MNKKILVALLLLAVLIAAAAFYMFSAGPIDKNVGKDDKEIREMFDCGNITANIRATDVYCSTPNLYRQHLEQNKVLKLAD